MFEIFAHSETWLALLTLTFLEIVLGVDNIIFISIVTNKLPENKQRFARNMGLMLAMVFRIALLLGIAWIARFTQPLYTIESFKILGMAVPEYHITGRNMILLLGGLFLIAKSTSEIFHKMDKEQSAVSSNKKAGLLSILIQIVLLDLIFSFDSILTAIGLAKEVLVMVMAVIISILIMMLFAGAISRFINKHPSLQILALSFLILIGFMLVLESLEQEIPKGYIYFAIFFSLVVELVNIRLRKKSTSSKT